MESRRVENLNTEELTRLLKLDFHNFSYVYGRTYTKDRQVHLHLWLSKTEPAGYTCSCSLKKILKKLKTYVLTDIEAKFTWGSWYLQCTFIPSVSKGISVWRGTFYL